MSVLWFWDSENNWWRGQRVEGAPKCNYRTHQCEINPGLDSCNTIIGLKSRYTSNIYKIPPPATIEMEKPQESRELTAGSRCRSNINGCSHWDCYPPVFFHSRWCHPAAAVINYWHKCWLLDELLSSSSTRGYRSLQKFIYDWFRYHYVSSPTEHMMIMDDWIN